MQLLETLFSEIIGFLGVKSFFSILNTQDYSQFLTYKGVVAIISPIMPLLLLLEFGVGLFYKKAQTKSIKSFLLFMYSIVHWQFISIAMVTICIGLFQSMLPFKPK